ncbi:UNVERIFIED_CONTAM: hypothetical protein Sangu_2629200 [Sesamum angustifolium]|uniref:DUF4283 domain-containing protein n=1 Tax=Sesamum angustifolium TaxID=2727405 RepID=A0AAW2J372_9LAMI
MAAMEAVIDGGPWLFQGQSIVLQRWELGMALKKHKHTQVPVWIKLRHLPVEFWTNEGLSMVASGIGRPLYPDAITKSCTRLDFARVCIMLDISSKLPKHIDIMMLTEEGGETPCCVDVEYEWVPPKCRACNSLGHRTDNYPTMQPQRKPPISFYLQKLTIVKPNEGPTNESKKQVDREEGSRMPTEVRASNAQYMTRTPSENIHKSKENVLYNPFDILVEEEKKTECSTRGPNRSSPLMVTND